MRKLDGGEQTAAEGGERAEGVKAVPTILHEHEPPHHPHHVPPVRACGRVVFIVGAPHQGPEAGAGAVGCDLDSHRPRT